MQSHATCRALPFLWPCHTECTVFIFTQQKIQLKTRMKGWINLFSFLSHYMETLYEQRRTPTDVPLYLTQTAQHCSQTFRADDYAVARCAFAVILKIIGSIQKGERRSVLQFKLKLRFLDLNMLFVCSKANQAAIRNKKKWHDTCVTSKKKNNSKQRKTVAWVQGFCSLNGTRSCNNWCSLLIIWCICSSAHLETPPLRHLSPSRSCNLSAMLIVSMTWQKKNKKLWLVYMLTNTLIRLFSLT